MAIGRDLIDLPFAELVRNLAVAIADGQTALDRNSLATLHALVEEEVPVVTEITEIIEPTFFDVTPAGKPPIEVTGARVTASGAAPVTMSMYQAGLSPTFYQFTEASIEVRLSITMREDRESGSVQRSQNQGQEYGGWWAYGNSRAYAQSVDFRTANKYSYGAQGASVLRATLRPVPPPARLEPTVTTVNTIAQPPLVTRGPA